LLYVIAPNRVPQSRRQAVSELSPTMAKNMIYSAISTMDRYYAGLMAVAYGDVDPKVAIAKSEKPHSPLPSDMKARLENLLETSPDDLPEE